jgi:hypothetical protein
MGRECVARSLATWPRGECQLAFVTMPRGLRPAAALEQGHCEAGGRKVSEVGQPDLQDRLGELQRWYVAQCNGDWEHTYGVTIESLDNPGWRVQIDLVQTELETLADGGNRVERSDTDWLVWQVADGRFEAGCGPHNLGEALEAFFALQP